MDIEEQMIAQPPEQPEQQYQQQQQQPINPKTKPTKALNLPREFYKAKRTLTRMVNEYFIQLKNELSMHADAKFVYAAQHIRTVESAIARLATVRYVDLGALVPKKSDIVDDFLLFYAAENQKIIKYNLNIQNSNNQKPKEISLESQEGLELPDSATPAAFGAHAYLFDCSKFDFERMVYVPMSINYKVNLMSGQVSVLETQPKFYRMKCCIIKVKRGFFIIGGLAGPQKSLTKQCLFYSIQTQKFHQISSLNQLHSCPSGCIHNDRVYIFSSSGIEYYNQNSNTWVTIEMPRRLHCLSFQYCISVSQNVIMIIGGKQCNQNSTDLRLYNTELNRVDEYAGMLPVGVSNERSWGPMIINNFVTVMSNVQASIYPQVMVKRDAFQMVLIGFGGCFLSTLIAS